MRLSSTGITLTLSGPPSGPLCMVYASLLPSLSVCFPPVNPWTGNFSGNDAIPPDFRLFLGSTPFTVIGGADLSRWNPGDPSIPLMLGIRDMADPESHNTFIRSPFGSIAQPYNGVVNITLIKAATTGSSGGFHIRSGSPSPMAVAQNSTNCFTASCTLSGMLSRGSYIRSPGSSIIPDFHGKSDTAVARSGSFMSLHCRVNPTRVSNAAVCVRSTIVASSL